VTGSRKTCLVAFGKGRSQVLVTANETGAGEPAGGYGSTTTEAESEKRTAGTWQPVSELSRRQRTRVASPGAGAVLCAACLLGQLLLNVVFCCFLPIPFGLSLTLTLTL